MRYLRERLAVIATAQCLNESGLSHGTSGNVSTRAEHLFFITPTGLPYKDMAPEQVVEMGLNEEEPRQGQLAPSSEWRFHRDIYRARPELNGIVHTHSTYATALACKCMEIPPFHYMVAMAAGPTVRCAPYATFGTQALSDNVVKAMADRRACLLANHGLIAAGADLENAYRLAQEVEYLAKVYAITLQLGGSVQLSDEEMQIVLTKFESYGKQPARNTDEDA